MGEGGGTDAGVMYWDYDPQGGGLNARDGFPEVPEDSIVDLAEAEAWLIPDTHLRAAGAQELTSADLTAEVVSTRPLEFDVNGDTNMADQLRVENPDPNVFTTILDVDGITFQIAGTGAGQRRHLRFDRRRSDCGHTNHRVEEPGAGLGLQPGNGRGDVRGWGRSAAVGRRCRSRPRL